MPSIQPTIYNQIFSPKTIQSTIKLKPLPIVTQIIRTEIENLGISKKYLGFKYVVDIISCAIFNNIEDAYNNNMFEFIASINHVNTHNVERDIRHMLISCYNSCVKIKNIVKISKINAKNILNNLIKYLKILI